MIEHLEQRDHAAESERAARYERAIAAFEALPSEERRRRRDDGLKPEQDTTPVFRTISTPLGALTGGGFLIDRGDVRLSAIKLGATIDAVTKVENMGTDSATTSVLARLLREISDHPRELADAVFEAASATRFFGRENMERIARWSNGETRFTYSRDGDDLIVDDASKGRTRIGSPGRFQMPQHPAIALSRQIVEGGLPASASTEGRGQSR